MNNEITNKLDAMIEQERRRSADCIDQYKQTAAAAHRVLHVQVVELLIDQEPYLYQRLSGEALEGIRADPELYDRLIRESTDGLVAREAKRPSYKKTADSSTVADSEDPAPRADEQDLEEVSSWND